MSNHNIMFCVAEYTFFARWWLCLIADNHQWSITSCKHCRNQIIRWLLVATSSATFTFDWLERHGQPMDGTVSIYD